MCYNINSWVWIVSCNIAMACVTTQTVVWNVSCNIGMTCVTTQTVALNCFLQHWYDLCYNINSALNCFLATLVWLVLQHKQFFWTVSCNIGKTCVTTQTVRSELVLATLVWLVLQHKYLVWIVSYNIGMTCVTTQTVGLNYFLQHWDDLCYNTNSCFELFLATLGWLVLQHKQLLWNVSCNIGMTCVTTQTVGTSHPNVARNISKQLFVL